MEGQKEGGISDLKNPIITNRVFESIPGFKEWIENTSLFSTIKRFAGSGIIIEGIPDGLRLQLNGISDINVAEDLPVELLLEFYLNSPFIVKDMMDQLPKLLENENTV